MGSKAVGAVGNGGDSIALRLICTTDLHGHVLPWDYLAGRCDPSIGLARIAPLIHAHRRRRANVMLFDNGDFLQGNPMTDSETDRLARGGAGPHAVVAAMNTLGYDAGTLGNHEFNQGLGVLRRVLRGFGHPLTSSNLTLAPGAGAPLVSPGLLLRRRLTRRDGRAVLLRIGVMGVAPPQTAEWDRLRLGGRLQAEDMVLAARRQAAELRARGADIVVLLAHSGPGAARPLRGAENAGRALAALPDIDALFLGHTHSLLPDPRLAGQDGVFARPVAQAGRFGSHLGVIDLDLRRAHPGDRWRSRGTGWIESPSARGCDAVTAAPVRRAHRAALAGLRRPVGHSTLPIDSHFALVAPDRSLQLAADALRAAAGRMLARRAEAALPLLVAVRPFRAGGHGGAGHYLSLPAGALTERHLQALHPHPDRLCLTVVDRAALLDWLERGAALFCRVLPGRRDQPLIDPARPPYGFEVIDGLDWRIDPSRPAGQGRVDDLRHDGRPVGPADRFVIATTSYRLGGEDALPRRLRAGQVPVEGPLLREALRAHLASGPVTPRPRPSWRFAALPRTAAWFDAPPEARQAAASLGARQIAPIGPAADGFHRFRLCFGPEGAALPIDSAPRLGYGGPARTRTPRCPAAMTL
ncbi:metallophosphoesterase [uncultured Limimaricola sp.]|uniref:metallophosphoesterase n=1 Tax=uncultured Limimaricola sp. TaxID=2211667 RepID=UPI0030F68B89